MLTATYTCVTISVEQSKLRRLLSRLQETIAGCLARLRALDRGAIESALQGIVQLEQEWRRRAMERYVIPALRGTTHELDRLLGELETLGQCLCDHLGRLREGMRALPEPGAAHWQDMARVFDGLRESLQHRLKKEEEELLPLLQRQLSAEAWFPIAAQLLTDDAQRWEGRRG